MWTAGVVNLVDLAYGLKLTTKKSRQLFRGRKVHSRENTVYAYVTPIASWMESIISSYIRDPGTGIVC